MKRYDIKKSFEIACKNKGMSVNDVRIASGIPRHTLIDILEGDSKEPSAYYLDQIANALGYKLWQFLELGDDK